ncbi:MAG: ACP S-malonyltransferase [Candidatus Aminicenantes bacterium]|nr:ACP S-malonyltransferase [Candidatus Aminicenantes bacterium]
MSPTAFLFPGQGSQIVGMGRKFFENDKQAREFFARADETLGYSLSKMCFEGPEEELKLTKNTQPALLVVSTIAFSLMGRLPDMAAGHSLGEYSALVASGVLAFEDALLLVHKRGRYMQEAVPVGVGAMAAVLGSTYEEVAESVKKVSRGVVEIANWNSEQQIVIAGHKEAVEEVLDILDPPRAVPLPVSAPFHCELMKSAAEKLSKDLDAVPFKDPAFPVVTNVDALPVQTGGEAREALKKQVRNAVLWYKTMELFNMEKVDVFVELGSGKVLSGLAKRISKKWDKKPLILNVEDPESLEKTKEQMS